MMSDEEEADGKFKVHRQEWRSEEFNEFMETLDNRAASSSSQKRPRMERFCGTPVKSDPPTDTKNWMINTNDDSGIVLAPRTPDSPNIV